MCTSTSSAPDRARRRRRQAPAHRRARATTRWRPTCACGCATRSTRSAPSSRRCRRSLLDLAERHAGTVMPGFTHLQVAQPVTFGHHLMAYFEMFARDRERLADCRKRVNRLPLGAAALAGTSYPIDRDIVAKELGFDGVCANSLDAVSDRDFAIEFCAARRADHDPHLAPVGGTGAVDEPALRLHPTCPTASAPAPRSCRRRRTRTCPNSRAARPAA